MRIKTLTLGLGCLFLLLPIFGQEQEKEGKGILEEVILMRLPPKVETQLVTASLFDVKALAIGLTDFEPSRAAWAILGIFV